MVYIFFDKLIGSFKDSRTFFEEFIQYWTSSFFRGGILTGSLIHRERIHINWIKSNELSFVVFAKPYISGLSAMCS